MNEDVKPSLINRNVTIYQLILASIPCALVVGGGIFGSWISIHDELNSLKYQVASFGSNTRVERLEFDDTAASIDRAALHKALDDFETSSINDRRDLRERLIKLESREK